MLTNYPSDGLFLVDIGIIKIIKGKIHFEGV